MSGPLRPQASVPPRHSEKGSGNEVKGLDPKNLAANVRNVCGEMLRFGFCRLRTTSVLSMTPPMEQGCRVILRNGAGTKSDDLTRRISRRLSVFACGEMLRFGFRRLRCTPVLSMTPPTGAVPPRHSEKGSRNEVKGLDPKNLAAKVRNVCGEMLRFGFCRLRCTPVLSMTPPTEQSRRVILRRGAGTKSDNLTRRISRRMSVMCAARCFGLASVNCVVLSFSA